MEMVVVHPVQSSKDTNVKGQQHLLKILAVKSAVMESELGKQDATMETLSTRMGMIIFSLIYDFRCS